MQTYDVFCDLSKSGTETFAMVDFGVTKESVCEWTGLSIEDFDESMNELGFVEFERGRDTCALVVKHGVEPPDDAFIANRY